MVMRTRSFRSSGNPVSSSDGHRAVLLQEVIDNLSIEAKDVVVDATLGGAGHAKALSEQLSATGVFVGIDADTAAVERAKTALKGTRPLAHLLIGNFRNIKPLLESVGVMHIDKTLFDLGWSGYQLSADRGFSFQKDEPLLMTYDAHPMSGALTAQTIVNEWEEDSIADILWGWGEERYARRIAKAIVLRRFLRPFKTSKELADVVVYAVPKGGKSRIHPATKTFQALRIAVNDELGALDEGLRGAWALMGSGARMAIISFHSIEDRAVKRLLEEWEATGEGKRLKRSVIKPTDEEVKENPRARSAKLRVIQKN